MSRKAYVILGVAFLLVVGGFLAMKTEKQVLATSGVDPVSLRPVKTQVVPEAEAVTVKEYPGAVKASSKVDLAFLVAGRLMELNVKEGQHVQKGDVLAKIDPVDFQNRVAAARAQFEEVKQNYDRIKALYDKNAIAKTDFDKVDAGLKVARSNLNIIEKSLKDTVLYAPFNGVIATRYVENFAQISAKQSIVSLQDVSTVEITINVPESEMAVAKRLDIISLTTELDSFPGRRYPLSIREWSTEADPYTQTFRVTFAMENPADISVLPGMSATVRAEVKMKDQQVLTRYVIPSAAVFQSAEGERSVWVLADENRVKRIPVAVGELHGDNISVTSGLKPGDVLITAGVHYLSEGQQVTLLK